MFGILYRLIIFILLIWLAKVVVTVVLRMFGPGGDQTRIHRGRPGPSAPPETRAPEEEIPEEDIIDVPYTEVDSKKSEAGKK